MMQIIDSLLECNVALDSARSGLVLTIGSFDGVHLGHQHLIRQLMARADKLGCRSGALTFHPHPRAVLRPNDPLNYLSTLDERTALLATLGLDQLVVVPFDMTVAATTAEAFVRHLHHYLGMCELWVGADFGMGHDREGTAERLGELGQELGYALHVVEPLFAGDSPISSTRIRRLLAQGNVSQAAALLGRPYTLSGPVVHGFERGRKLGFPTANVALAPERAIPAYGVYAVRCCWNGIIWPGVAGIGVRPTFDNGDPSLEVYLLDYAGDLYGVEMTVEFVEHLRPELRFDDIADLVLQLERDVADARSILGVKTGKKA